MTMDCVNEHFYVGGQYVEKQGQHYMEGQIYVERFVPKTKSHPYPIVFISGTAQTGTTWMTKPDGNKGWLDYFLQQGYEAYVVDQPARGRSNYLMDDGAEYMNLSTEKAEYLFSNYREKGNWKNAKQHTQWPGTGKPGDVFFDEFFSSQVGYLKDNAVVERLMQHAGVCLLNKIGESILITHSQAGVFGWLIADRVPKLVKGIVALEPLGPPYRKAIIGNNPARLWGVTDIPMQYTPSISDASELKWKQVDPPGDDYVSGWLQDEPVHTLPNLCGIPICIITSEASYHRPCDIWTSRFLKQAGVTNEYIELEKHGIHGNGHMMMVEKNSDAIATLIEEWITQNIK